MNSTKVRFFLYIVITLFSVTLFASQPPDASATVDRRPIELNDSLDELIINYSGLQIFIDSTAKATFAQINDSSEKRFRIFPDFRNTDYSYEYVYWIKLNISVEDTSDKIWILEFFDQTIDLIEAYIPDEKGEYSKKVFGDKLRYEERTFMHKNFHLILPEFQESYTIYIRIQSERFADIRVAFRSVERLVYYAVNEYFLYGIFYGMILIICLYNMLMYSAMREVKYVYYTFYLLGVAIYAMCIDGIAFQYLWPDSPLWNQYAAAVSLYFVIVGAIIFSRKFLRTKVRLPRHDRVFRYLILIRTLYFFIALAEGRYLLDLRSVEIVPLGFIFYTGILTWLRGYRPARFFVIAYGILFIGFMIKGLIYLNIIPFTIITYYTLHFAFLLEMLFLTFALADRVRILKGNRDKAQKRVIKHLEVNADLRDKVNKELEEEVKKRTLELEEKNKLLEETNTKLEQQTKDISQINSILDLDNWKLKNNLKEVLKDQVFPKKLSFDEFKSIFPDDISCMRYLYKLKWINGYSCKKCKHQKYTDGSKSYSLRCTRCGYDESVTAHTIFQGIKFPVNKAFFILYTIMMQDHKLTIDQLAEMLQMRRNTVWNFKRKIKDAIKANKYAPEFATTDWKNIMVEFGTKIRSSS